MNAFLINHGGVLNLIFSAFENGYREIKTVNYNK